MASTTKTTSTGKVAAAQSAPQNSKPAADVSPAPDNNDVTPAIDASAVKQELQEPVKRFPSRRVWPD